MYKQRLNSIKYYFTSRNKDKLIEFTFLFRIKGFSRLKDDDKALLTEKLGKGTKG